MKLAIRYDGLMLSVRLSLGREQADIHTSSHSFQTQQGGTTAIAHERGSSRDPIQINFLTAAPIVMSHCLYACTLERGNFWVRLDGRLARTDIMRVLKCVGAFAFAGRGVTAM
ncbi:hypothetical protein AMECASPLE_037094 [Ameca splendens]|uniref:Uncharacterized protein n=1 Tax=Ameca splendens TaxID=208324 RepID=A0ABV0XWW6_9TELE